MEREEMTWREKEEYMKNMKREIKEEISKEWQEKELRRENYQYNNRRDIRCYRCGSINHISRICSEGNNKVFKNYLVNESYLKENSSCSFKDRKRKKRRTNEGKIIKE
jgi:Zinc knuckle